MSEKITYMPKDIYFGVPMVNAGDEGFYELPVASFIKINDPEGNAYYKKLGTTYKCYEYEPTTDAYVAVKVLCPMTNLMKEEKHNQAVTTNTIKAYLLKYKVLSSIKKNKQKTETLESEDLGKHY